MNSAKFLVLAMEAFRARKFEEAGSLFAQANECHDSAELQGQLLQAINVQVPEQATAAADSDLSDADDEARVISVSNAQRRVVGSSRIKQMLAAAIEATAADDSGQEVEGESDFDDDLDSNPEAIPEFDPDVPGAKLLPVSFSSGTVSPVRVKSR